MEFLNQINAVLPQNVIIILLTVLLFSLFGLTYAIGYFLGSRRYKFYRNQEGVSFTVTRYLIGLIPIYKKTYKGLKHIEVEDYIYTDEGTRYDCARLYAHLKSGENIHLKKLTTYSNERNIKKIAADIETLIQSRKRDALIIHNCRIQSFVLAFFGYTLGVPFLIGFLWMIGYAALPSIEAYLSQQDLSGHIEQNNNNNPDVHLADSSHNVSDLPSNFPIIDDTVITKINFKNKDNTWEVWLDANNYEPIKLHEVIKQAVQAKGWETSRTEDFPSYDNEGNAKPDSGYIFYLRNAEHTLEGDVIITKGINGLVGIISVPVKPEVI